MSEEDSNLVSYLSLSSLIKRIEEGEEKGVMRLKSLVTNLVTNKRFKPLDTRQKGD